MQRAIEGELNLFLSIRKKSKTNKTTYNKWGRDKGQQENKTGKHKQTIVAPTKTKGFYYNGFT